MEDPIRGEKQHLNALPRRTEVKDNVRCSTFIIKRTLHSATLDRWSQLLQRDRALTQSTRFLHLRSASEWREVSFDHIPSRRRTVVRDTPVLRRVAHEIVCLGRAHQVRPIRRASETMRHVRAMMMTAKARY